MVYLPPAIESLFTPSHARRLCAAPLLLSALWLSACTSSGGSDDDEGAPPPVDSQPMPLDPPPVTERDDDDMGSVEGRIADISFSDSNLRRCVADTGIARVEDLTSLECNGDNIASTEGLQFLTALTELRLRNNALTSIDVSANTSLRVLDLGSDNSDGNRLASVDLSRNSLLIDLDLSNNQLDDIDITANAVLENLNISRNTIRTIDLSGNTALIGFLAANNDLSSPNLSALVNLERLDLSFNNFSSLDLTANTALTSLVIEGIDALTNVDISQNTQLTELSLNASSVATVDMANNTALRDVSLTNVGELMALNVSNNPSLMDLDLRGSGLDCDDVSGLNTNTTNCRDLSNNNIGDDSQRASDGCNGNLNPPLSTGPSEGGEALEINVGGRTGFYEVFLPVGYDGLTPRPVYTYYHGGSSRTANKLSLRGGVLNQILDRGYILVTPHHETGSQNTASLNRDVALSRAIHAQVLSDYCVDDSRYFVSGFSAGGAETYTQIESEEPNNIRYRAAAPLAGVADTDLDERVTALRTPILAHHAPNDGTVQFRGGVLAFTQKVGVEDNSCDFGVPLVRGNGQSTDEAQAIVQVNPGNTSNFTCKSFSCNNVPTAFCSGYSNHRVVNDNIRRSLDFFDSFPSLAPGVNLRSDQAMQLDPNTFIRDLFDGNAVFVE